MQLKKVPLGFDTRGSGPFAPVIAVGHWHFFSGIVPTIMDRQPHSPRFDVQVHEVLDELESRLNQCALTRRDLCLVLVRLNATPFMDAYDAFNELYGRFLAGVDPLPAREVIGVSELPYGVKLEITAVAVKQDEDEDDL